MTVSSERNVVLWAVVSEFPTTKKHRNCWGWQREFPSPPEDESNLQKLSAMIRPYSFQKILRSGTRVEYPGHIVIFGDMNPGAEVVAEGDVIVWGRVRGMIHAGAKGNRSSFICALDLSANQLRIADEVSAMLKPQKDPKPEIASINREGRYKPNSGIQANPILGMNMTAQVITVTSGKGGVGKTTAVANLATALAASGKRVVCIDGDIGLRNLDVIMGLENRIVYDIVDVIEGRCKLKQAMIRDKHYPSMYLIPAAQTQTRTLFRRLTWCASATTSA